jgi:6-phosphogluconolactonase
MRLSLTSLAVFGSALLMPASAQSAQSAPEMFAYVGTYSTGDSKGIYQYRVQENSSGLTLTPLGLAAAAANPSFLAVDTKRRVLFAVNETSDFGGKPSGAVSAYAMEAGTGRLTLLNQKPTNGTDPCHIVLDPSGQNVLIANYSSGSVAVYRVGSDGRLGEMSSFVQHQGKSVHPDRQKGPHAHAINFDPSGRLVFVCDLGMDKVMAYQFDAATGKLTPATPASIPLAAGAGPRHMTFRADGRFAYVVNELNSTVTAFAVEPGTSRFREVQTISTLPPDFKGRSTCAEIQLHSSGSFLYASNRGHDSLAVFAVDAASGKLRAVDYALTGGRTPRHFDFSPAGTHVVAANQETGTLQISTIDPKTGRLQAAASLVPAPVPVCVVFAPIAR